MGCQGFTELCSRKYCLGYVIYVDTILIQFKHLPNHDTMVPETTFCHLGPRVTSWYLHQVLKSMTDGIQAKPADRMSHNRSLDPQMKKGGGVGDQAELAPWIMQTDN